MKRGESVEHFGQKFKRIDLLFKARADKNLEKIGLTLSQMNVIIFLDVHRNEKVTQKMLAEAFNVKHSTMAGILHRLKEKELIEITVNPENKKYKNIITTPKAELIKEESIKNRNVTESVSIKRI